MKLLIILALAISSVFGSTLADNEMIKMGSTAESVSSYLEKNISVVNEVYRISGVESDIQAIENIYDVIVDTKIDIFPSKLLDFDGLKGFLLLGDDYSVFDFTSSGEPVFKFKNGINQLYYFPNSGYYNYDGYNFQSFSDDYNQDDSSKNYYNPYPGQKEAGAGTIYDPDLYVKSRYGSSYSINEINSLNYATNYHMGDLSVYSKDQKSEGNCALVAPYNFMQCLSMKSDYSKLPKQTTTENYNASIKEPLLYEKNKLDSNYKVYNNRSFPSLYAFTRKNTYDKYKRVEGFTAAESSGIVERVMKDFGYSLNLKEDYIGSAFNYKKPIDNGKPLLWSTTGGTYGNHMMMMFGYRFYRKSSKVLFLTVYDWVELLTISDGWECATRYMDFTAYVGIATFCYY